METVEIQIDQRKPGSKQEARRLRREGKLPGVFYGPKAAAVPLSLDKKEFLNRFGSLEGSHLVRLKSDSDVLADKVALVKELQFHPVTGEILHADFYEVDLAAKIQVEVPLHFVGKATGVVQGGILQPVVREIKVECLPMEIPDFFNVDVSSLDIGHSLHLADIGIPEGVTVIDESNFTLVTVVPPTVEEAPVVEEAPAVEGEEAEAPVVGTEEKKEEEGSAS